MRPVKISLTQSLSVISALIVLFALLGSYYAFYYAHLEYQRDVDAWRWRLSISADQKQQVVEEWILNQQIALQDIGYNPAVAPLFGSLGEGVNIAKLKAYLNAMAADRGFVDTASESQLVDVLSIAGIVLFSEAGDPVLQTANLDPNIIAYGKRLSEQPVLQPAVLEFFTASQQRAVGFLVPVLNLNSSGDEDQVRGYVLGIKPLSELKPVLAETYLEKVKAESFLVQVSEGVVKYLTPASDVTSVESTMQTVERLDNDVAFAAANTSQVEIKKTMKMEDVIVAGRTIADANWTLIVRVNKELALRDAEERQTLLITVLLSIMAGLIIAAIGLWRHGASIRNAKLLKQLQEVLEKCAANERLLSLVTDNQPDPVIIVDKDGFFHFANLEALESFGMTREDIAGKSLESVVGASRAIEYRQHNQRAMERVESNIFVDDVTVPGRARKIVQAKHIPITQIPTVRGEDKPGVLIVEQDITTIIQERELRERNMRQLVDALVSLVDQYDPFASNHSKRVGELAEKIAAELELGHDEVETVAIAGRLVNLNKMFVPQTLLTKKSDLTPGDRKKLSEAVDLAAEFIRTIEFKGPVYEMLRQIREHVDGTGRLGLKGKEILQGAQIIAVANAYIAMSSPRAYRPEISPEEVIQTLMLEANKKYSPTVVSALVTHLEKAHRRVMKGKKSS